MRTRRQFLLALIPGLAGVGLLVRERGPATFDVTDPRFGADPSGRRDSTEGIAMAAAALQEAGGGTLFFPRGTYRVFGAGGPWRPAANPLASFSGLEGVSVIGEEATLSVEWRFALHEYADLFEFTDCTDVAVLGLSGTVPPYYRYSIAEDQRGPRLVRLLGACRDVDVAADLTRFAAGVMISAPGLEPEEPRTRGVRVNLDLVECLYGLSCQFSGDDVEAAIRADRIGRSYFVYGVRDHDVTIESRNNNRDDCVLAGYRGRGLERIRVSYRNEGSSSALPAAAGVAIDAHWEGQPGETGCVFREIEIDYQVIYPDEGYPGHALHVRKYDPAGGYDSVDRGHVYDGIVITGRVRGSPGRGESLPIRWDGVWGGGEIYRNWTLRDLRFEQTSWADVNLTSLKSGGLLSNVQSDNHVYIRGNPAVPIRVVGSRAKSFSLSRDDRSKIEFVDSVITSEEGQSRINKSFVRTRLGDG